VECPPARRAKTGAALPSLKGKPELHFRSGCAPDPNPEEFGWTHMRRNRTPKTPRRKNELLKSPRRQ
jgi:hypothetical protein